VHSNTTSPLPYLQLLWDYFFGCNNESLRLRETVPLTVHYRWADAG